MNRRTFLKATTLTAPYDLHPEVGQSPASSRSMMNMETDPNTVAVLEAGGQQSRPRADPSSDTIPADGAFTKLSTSIRPAGLRRINILFIGDVLL
jgi:hypothetical protein